MLFFFFLLRQNLLDKNTKVLDGAWQKRGPQRKDVRQEGHTVRTYPFLGFLSRSPERVAEQIRSGQAGFESCRRYLPCDDRQAALTFPRLSWEKVHTFGWGYVE